MFPGRVYHVFEIVCVENVAGNMEAEIPNAIQRGVDLRPKFSRTMNCKRCIDCIRLKNVWTQVCKFRGVTCSAASVLSVRRACEKRKQRNACNVAHFAIAVRNADACISHVDNVRSSLFERVGKLLQSSGVVVSISILIHGKPSLLPDRASNVMGASTLVMI